MPRDFRPTHCALTADPSLYPLRILSASPAPVIPGLTDFVHRACGGLRAAPGRGGRDASLWLCTLEDYPADVQYRVIAAPCPTLYNIAQRWLDGPKWLQGNKNTHRVPCNERQELETSG